MLDAESYNGFLPPCNGTSAVPIKEIRVLSIWKFGRKLTLFHWKYFLERKKNGLWHLGAVSTFRMQSSDLCGEETVGMPIIRSTYQCETSLLATVNGRRWGPKRKNSMLQLALSTWAHVGQTQKLKILKIQKILARSFTNRLHYVLAMILQIRCELEG